MSGISPFKRMTHIPRAVGFWPQEAATAQGTYDVLRGKKRLVSVLQWGVLIVERLARVY